ncbi:AraC family transcriptional regulator [Chitinophaga sp. SYP-B3965]|uniref:helix-turn-helix domain-containing protein n=1 Tax=Chitinophaga sp. SYP-B3965 TaxID=2663120 RepID=UPI001566507F|nr:helix-turn-helix transcriptional regulator [Chitinophaga sp. SYP-B3965]
MDVFSLIVLLGALQALFFSIYLYFSPSENKIQKRSLAFFIFILSYNGFETLNWSAPNFRYQAIFDLFPFVLIYGLGPSIYLYIRSFRTAVTIRKAWRYYVFVFVAFVVRFVLVVIWILQVNGKRKIVNDPGVLMYWYGTIAEPLSVIVFTVFWLLAIREYRQIEEEDKFTRRWLKTLLAVWGVFALLWVGTVASPYIFSIGDEMYYVIEVALVIFIYWIGYAGYYRTRIIYITQQKKTQSYFDNLPPGEVNGSIDALQQAMEKDRLYLDPELTINSLAAHIGVPPKTLSAVLNQGLQKGFSEYVNAWRVEAVKQMILDPGNRHMTITGIAYDCGFNSQPTFQRAFKAVTGQTPRDFMQNSSQIRN